MTGRFFTPVGLCLIAVTSSLPTAAASLVEPTPDPAPGDGAAATREAWRVNDVAAPGWAREEHRAAPQAKSDPPDDSRRTVGALEGVPLACELSVRRPRGWDMFRGKPDLTARVVVGWLDTAGVTIKGPNDRGAMRFTVPAVHLRPGEKIKMSAIDRDFTEHDWVGAVLVRYDGRVPIVFKHQLFQGRCAPLDVGDAFVAQAEAGIAKRLRAVKRAKPSAKDRAFGFASADAREARAAIEDLAARRGWTGERVVSAVAAYDEAVEAFSVRAAVQVKRLQRQPASLATPAGVALTVEEPRFSCQPESAERHACTLRARFTAGRRTDVLDAGGIRRDHIARAAGVLLSDGQLAPLEGGRFLLDGAKKDRRRVRVRSGDEGEGVWRFSYRGAAAPVLLRVSLGRKRYAWLPLTPPDPPPGSSGPAEATPHKP